LVCAPWPSLLAGSGGGNIALTHVCFRLVTPWSKKKLGIILGVLLSVEEITKFVDKEANGKEHQGNAEQHHCFGPMCP
jgi:hypothetical protein